MTEYKSVANFLSEILFNILPKDFVQGKNKKTLNKKILQFVKFNRFESFTRILMLNKFQLGDMKWLNFQA